MVRKGRLRATCSVSLVLGTALLLSMGVNLLYATWQSSCAARQQVRQRHTRHSARRRTQPAPPTHRH